MWFDAALVESVVEATPIWLAFLFLFISYLGSIYFIAPATVYCYLQNDDPRTATWLGIVICAYALFVFTKPIVGIDRPEVGSPIPHEDLPIILAQIHELAVEFDSDSFPSGHAIAATVFYGLVVIDLDVGTRKKRFALATVALLLIFTSRVVLGVHYVGDVIGGAILGLALLAGLLFVRNKFDRPLEILLAVAALLAVGGALLDRPIDSAILLSAIAITFVGHRKFDLHGVGLPTLLRLRQPSESSEQ